jgi:hypothetical protein
MNSANIRRLATSAAVAVTLLAGLSFTVAQAPRAEAASSVGGEITQSEVVARAWYWVNLGSSIKYDDSGHTSVPDVSGSRSYRPDCSGAVSMALHMSQSYTTGSLPTAPGVSLITAHPSASTALRTGDFLNVHDGPNGEHHAVLFDHWDSNHVTFSVFSFGGGGDGRLPPQHLTGQSFSGKIASHPGSVYKAYRYSKVIPDVFSVPRKPSISVGDLDNDGIIDLTGLKPNGDVYFDRNTGAGNGVSWGGGFLADGVSSYVQIAVGDLNNDGKNDLIGLTADSDVYFNLNTGVGNGVTWGGSWLAVGSSGYTGIDVGDLNNDGTVDLAGRRADGNVYLNPNIGTNSDNGITWGTEIPVFEGAHYTNISVGDLNNDGVIDLAGRKADGNIYISINTGAGNGVTWRETFKAVGGQSLDTFDIGDLDNDGLNDITARTADHSIWLYPNNGTGNGISWDKQRLVYGTSPY